MVAKCPRSGMMGQIVPSMAPPPAPQQPRRRRDRLLSLLGGLALLVPLGGCTLGRELPNVIYVAIGANKDQIIDAELKQEFQVGLREVEARFRQIHPDTHFQFGLYPEDQMVEVMRQRSRSGLAPDLLLVNGDTALHLRQAGLVDPFPIRKDQLAIFNEEELGRLRSPDGQLAGLPVLVQTQLGCASTASA
jgi:arabinogalactan oligomer / maltooligosaccharide transport system substrate-binding protein